MDKVCRRDGMEYAFSAEIIRAGELDAAYVVVPLDIRKEFGTGRVKVHAFFDDVPYDGSIVNMGVRDEAGNVCHILGIRKDIRKLIGKQPGDMVEVRFIPADVFPVPGQGI